MLRIAVLILLLANAGYWYWARSQPDEAAREAESERLEQQISPEHVQVLSPRELQVALVTPAVQPQTASDSLTLPIDLENPATLGPQMDNTSTPGVTFINPPFPTEPMPQPSLSCMQAGIFDARQADTLRTALASWPESSWHMESTPMGARWMVYLGPLANDKAVAAMRAQLRALRIDHDRPGAALEPGLSLGRFSSEEAALRQRDELARRNINPTRVVTDRPAAPGFTLRLPAVDATLRARLTSLQAALGNKTLRPCN